MGKRGKKIRIAKWVTILLQQRKYEEVVQLIIDNGNDEDSIIQIVRMFDESQVHLLLPIASPILSYEMFDADEYKYEPFFDETLRKFKTLIRKALAKSLEEELQQKESE